MAIFKKGIKMGKHDFPLAIEKQRGQGILRKIGIIDAVSYTHLTLPTTPYV